MAYYDGAKLLSMKDINGNKPEIYLCTTNRTGGKTTYFSRYMVNRFINHGEKFMLLYRFGNELNQISDKFFKDIQCLFFPNYIMSEKKQSKGKYIELFLAKKDEANNQKSCGYAISLNSADYIKKMSHLFSDTSIMFLDEFQSETDHYCDNEISKFISIHSSVARGQGKQTRYVPVIMCSNAVTLLNPYYVLFGISARLRDDTKFLRGTGYVLEQGYIDSAAQAMQQSAFMQACAGSDYVNYAAQNVYLNDNNTFIDKPSGSGRYLGTIKYKNQEYGLRDYQTDEIVYCDDRPDTSYPYKIALTVNDHDVNYQIARNNSVFIGYMRMYFDRGSIRFKNLQCKEAFIKMVSYR